MFKTKRRKELEAKEYELFRLEQEIRTMKDLCSADSPEIGFAMLHLENKKRESVSAFREKLRSGFYTFAEFKLRNERLY